MIVFEVVVDVTVVQVEAVESLYRIVYDVAPVTVPHDAVNDDVVRVRVTTGVAHFVSVLNVEADVVAELAYVVPSPIAVILYSYVVPCVKPVKLVLYVAFAICYIPFKFMKIITAITILATPTAISISCCNKFLLPIGRSRRSIFHFKLSRSIVPRPAYRRAVVRDIRTRQIRRRVKSNERDGRERSSRLF